LRKAHRQKVERVGYIRRAIFRADMLKRYCVILLLTFINSAANAQTVELKDPGYDTSYIKSFRDDLVVTLVSASAGNEISATDKSGKNITFSTNLPTSYGIGLDYKWLTFEYTSSFGRTGPPEKGYTQMKSLGFGLTTRKFWFRNFYHNTQGYYLKNPEYFNPDFNPATDIYPFRNDVRSSVYYATLNYGFNHRRFSNMAAIWQLERQKKSAGTFTAGVSFSIADYKSDSALFPEQFENTFDETEAITDFEFKLYGINAGYLHTFSFGKNRECFVSLTLIPGLSYQIGTAHFEEKNQPLKKQTFGLHTEGRIVAGYNGDKWYSSITAISYVVSSVFEGTNPFSQGYTFGRIAIGYKITMKETKSPFLKKLGL
jgi:hypothetical protein